MKEAGAGWPGPPVALLWDQSLVWGLICLETLRRFHVPFRLWSAEDVVSGKLEGHRILLVPGGWAAHKLRVLGEAGKSCIRGFIEAGGSYLGFCGGAGLALSSPSAPGFVPIRRLELSQRLPSASGQVRIQGLPHHPAWKDLPLAIPVSIWWPSQFSAGEAPGLRCLATYTHTGQDFHVADLPAADMEEHAVSWEKWERVYGVNLDPAKLMGHPAIIEYPLGRGRLILSYPHLETPNDAWGNRLFLNLLTYLDRQSALSQERQPAPTTQPHHSHGTTHSHAESQHTWIGGDHPLSSEQSNRLTTPPGPVSLDHFSRTQGMADELIDFGERHLLWKWRHPWLLQWRRGIRGLEYGSLAVVARSFLQEARKLGRPSALHPDPWLIYARKIEEDTREFCRLSRRLLLEEKLATQSGHVSKLGEINQTVDEMRARLFGKRMNHGGLCRALFDEWDTLLLHVLRQSPPGTRHPRRHEHAT